MKTYWAIEWTPHSKQAKPWIYYRSIHSTRKATVAHLYENATPEWRKEIDARRRKNIIRIVRVTVEITEVRGNP